MKIKVKVESLIWRKDQGRPGVVLFELLPAITFRYVDWELGYEYNVYLSWLAWCISITLTKN